MRPAPSVLPLAGALGAVVLTAGCSATGSSAAPASPAVPPAPAVSSAPPAPATAPPASPEPDPMPVRAELDVLEVATRYLAARENAISYTHPTPRSWLTEAREVMTPTGWRRLSDSLGSSGGFPAATARAHKWSVRTDVSCQHHPDAGPPTATRATLICGVTDTTVDASGNPVPAKALPAVWPYQRPQTSALLLLRQVGGRWLVDADQTGQAG